jgi:L-asparagine oxygenase
MQTPMVSIESKVSSEKHCRELLDRHFDLIPQYTGNVTHYVQSEADDRAGFNSRGSAAIGFHNDAYDYFTVPSHLALYCIESECDGGDTFFADFSQAVEKLAQADRDLLVQQHITFHTDPAKFYQTPGVGVTRPILDGSSIRYSSGYIKRTEAHTGLHETLDRLDDLLMSAHRAISLKPGDLLILDNRSLVHGRTAFFGHRKLSRYWLYERRLA